MRRLLVLPVFLLLLFVPISEAADDAIILGIHPYLPSTELVKRFMPLADYLAKSAGRHVSIQISKDYNDHIGKVGRDDIDIAFMGPASFVKMRKTYGPKPLLARLEIEGSPTFHGEIFVLKDSPVMELSELAGRSFAFGDPASTMSHLVPRYMLWKAGVKVEDLSRHVFLDNHDNVALGVLVGDFDAGAVKHETFLKYKDRGLRAIAETPLLSEHVFVASNRLDPGTVKEVREALMRLSDDPAGGEVMSAIKEGISGMVPVSDSDYRNLREILDALESMGVSY